MKVGPLTFQCACLVCVCRSMASASRAFSSATALTRVASGRSFFVLNMANLLSRFRLLDTRTAIKDNAPVEAIICSLAMTGPAAAPNQGADHESQ